VSFDFLRHHRRDVVRTIFPSILRGSALPWTPNAALGEHGCSVKLAPMPPARLDRAGEELFWFGVRAAERFFMGEAEVQKALDKLVDLLNRESIPYAVIGAMALNEFGYRRVTVDVDLLIDPADHYIVNSRGTVVLFAQQPKAVQQPRRTAPAATVTITT
jgi:hypothetical protein